MNLLHDLMTGLLLRGVLLILLAGIGGAVTIFGLMYIIEKGNQNRKW